MPEYDRPDAALEVALDRYWDAVLAGADCDSALEALAPELAATVRHARALDTVASPRAAFASTLWEDLMHTSAHTAVSSNAPPTGPALAVRPTAPVTRRFPRRLTDPFSHIAAAVLLVALLAAAALMALYPHLPKHDDGLPLFAPEVATPARPALAAETTLLDLTLPDLPPAHIEGGLAITDYPPGGGSQERAATSAEVFTIVVGPMQATVVKAPQPVQVVPPDAAGPDPSEQMRAGQSATLPAGATVIAPPGAVVELLNTGTAPTRMLDLLWVTASGSTERGGAEWWKGFGGISQDIAAPVRITVRQEAMPPGATIAAPDAADTVQSANVTDLSRLLDLRYSSDGSFRNAGDETVDAYVLAVTSQATSPVATAVASAVASPDRIAFLWQSTGGPEPMVHPYGVAIDPQGNVWVADGDSDRFEIFAPDGVFLETWGTSGSAEGQFRFASPHGLSSQGYGDVAFDAHGNLYVADTGNFRVQKFAPDRTFLLAWGREGTQPGQFLAPGGVAVSPDGEIYVSDESRHDVQRFDADGTYRGVIGTFGVGKGQISLPAGVATDLEGNVWVADYGASRILEFSPSGEFLASWGRMGTGDGEIFEPNDVTVDRLGRVIVVDTANNRIQVFTPDGQFLATVGAFGTNQPGQFRNPSGAAVDKNNVIYVSDNVRVQAFQLPVARGGTPSS
jgi:sugar lactone lactonase YvrE